MGTTLSRKTNLAVRRISSIPFINYGTRVEMIKEEAEIMKLIFKKYIKRGNMRMVSNWLNENNIKTRNGFLWQDSTISKILSRKTYIGIVEMSGESYEDKVLKIIDDELFITCKLRIK